MDISSITGSLGLTGTSNNFTKTNSNVENKSFQDMLNNAINDVNDQQIDGYNAMEGIATGKVTNLQEAVQKIEEAELSMQLALEVKNKALNAYSQIMKMQI